MTTTKHSVVLPDGKVATRNSKTRTYTHAIATQRTAQWHRLHHTEDAESRAGYAAKYRQDLASNGEITQRWGRKQVEEWIADAEAVAELSRKAAAEAQDSPWGAFTWCGSLQLALKQYRKCMSVPGLNARIIEVSK